MAISDIGEVAQLRAENERLKRAIAGTPTFTNTFQRTAEGHYIGNGYVAVGGVVVGCMEIWAASQDALKQMMGAVGKYVLDLPPEIIRPR